MKQFEVAFAAIEKLTDADLNIDNEWEGSYRGDRTLENRQHREQ
jgi:hypothetical protein